MIRISYLITTSLSTIVDLLRQILEKLDDISKSVHKLVRLLKRALNDDLEEWIAKDQAMAYLDITKSTYYRWVQEGILKPRGVAGQDKFYKRDLAKLLEERRYRHRKKTARKPDSEPT